MNLYRANKDYLPAPVETRWNSLYGRVVAILRFVAEDEVEREERKTAEKVKQLRVPVAAKELAAEVIPPAATNVERQSSVCVEVHDAEAEEHAPVVHDAEESQTQVPSTPKKTSRGKKQPRADRPSPDLRRKSFSTTQFRSGSWPS